MREKNWALGEREREKKELRILVKLKERKKEKKNISFTLPQYKYDVFHHFYSCLKNS